MYNIKPAQWQYNDIDTVIKSYKIEILIPCLFYVRTIWPFGADCVIPDRLATQILKGT